VTVSQTFVVADYIEVTSPSHENCYKQSWLGLNHFKLYLDAAHTQEFTNTTEISISKSSTAALDFGFNFTIHNDKFWYRNFTLYAKLTTLGEVSMTKPFEITLGPNCWVEGFNVTTLDG
jgi:hypothetical protein